MIKINFLIFSLAIVLFACEKANKEEAQSNDFIVSGTIKNASGKVYLESLYQFNQWIMVDTAEISKDGSYLLRGTTVEKDFFRIRWANDHRSYVVAILDKGDSAEINVDALNVIKSVEVKNSNETVLMMAFNRQMEEFNRIHDSLTTSPALTNNIKADDEDAIWKVKELEKQTDAYIKRYVDSIAPSITSIMLALDYLNAQNDYDFLFALNEKIKKGMPDSKYTSFLSEQIAKVSAKRFATGHPAPDFTLKDQNGKEVSLASFKGKIVLVDFWASWCGPCRKENPAVVKIYQKYKDKGFDILSVSLDRERDPWVEAFKNDGLVWTQVWDEKQEAAQKYNVNEIPATFLVDKEGNLITQNLRGDALDAKLEELLK